MNFQNAVAIGILSLLGLGCTSTQRRSTAFDGGRLQVVDSGAADSRVDAFVSEDGDSGRPILDAGLVREDSATLSTDAGPEPTAPDSGPIAADGGPGVAPDSGRPSIDAGHIAVDAGGGGHDAGSVDPGGGRCAEGAVRSCGTDTGECVTGRQTCVGGVWSVCSGVRLAEAESCNGLDDDCDGISDEDFSCVLGSSRSCGETDVGECAFGLNYCVSCRWSDACVDEIWPRTEGCDMRDNDCDGRVDEALARTFYRDADRDSYGATAETTVACLQPSGYVTNDRDCDDTRSSVYPYATEQCNGRDDDCDGSVDDDASRQCASGLCEEAECIALHALEPALDHYLKGTSSRMSDELGTSVAVSGDGEVVVVGVPGDSACRDGGLGPSVSDTACPGEGAAYVFARVAGEWVRRDYLKGYLSGAGAAFGTSVAIDGDGSIIAVGSPDEDSNGRVTVFEFDGSRYGILDTTADYSPYRAQRFGISVALSEDGDTLVAGVPRDNVRTSRVINASTLDGVTYDSAETGGAYVFVRGAIDYTMQALLKYSRAYSTARCGESVAIDRAGQTIVVGCPGQPEYLSPTMPVSNVGSAAYFRYERSGWSQAGQFVLAESDWLAYGQFGAAVAISGAGERIAVGAPAASYARVYRRLPSLLYGVGEALVAEAAAGDPEEDEFGSALAFSEDGTSLWVGAPGSDACDLDAPDRCLRSGAVFGFAVGSTTSLHSRYLRGPVPGGYRSILNSDFGRAVAVDDAAVLIAATNPAENSCDTFVSSPRDGEDSACWRSGALYLFE